MQSPVVHFDITGPNEKEQHLFYAALLGWRVDAKGPGYALVQTPDGGPNGALIDAETASVAIGVAVADLDAALAHAVELGGSVLMPRTDNGWVVKAQVADPAGNVLTLIQQ